MSCLTVGTAIPMFLMNLLVASSIRQDGYESVRGRVRRNRTRAHEHGAALPRYRVGYLERGVDFAYLVVSRLENLPSFAHVMFSPS
jgi:hypothetical protein